MNREIIGDKSFKELTFWKKVGYIWDYYKWHIFIAIVCVCVVITAVTGLINKKDYKGYCLVFNDSANPDLTDRIEAQFPEFYGDSEYLVRVDNGYYFNYTEEAGFNMPEDSASIKFMCSTDVDEADVILTDYNSMLWAADEEFLLPLDELLPSELYGQLEPYFVYATFPGQDSNDGRVYGLDVTESEVYDGCIGNYDNPIVSVINLSERTDFAVDFIKYMYGIK